jgi:pimeloyl-ACP methyl ester carboxylesterase
MTDAPIPVIFIHGLWLHPLSWTEWADVFEAAGYRAMAPGWPGVPDTVAAARTNPDSIANHGIDDVTSHYASIIASLPAKPVLVGHSFGGMIAEKLLGQDLAAAAIAIDAAQIKGVLPLPLSSLRSTLPVFRNPANKHLAVSLTAEQFRYSFGNAIDPGESDSLYEQWTIPAPGRPLFEAAAANFSLHFPRQGQHHHRQPRPAAAHHGRPGPHRPGSHHQIHAQAVPSLGRGQRPDRVPRSRALGDHRPRLARRRQRLPGLALQAQPVRDRAIR